MLDPTGAWLVNARRVASPNCDERPPGIDVELVVVHGISLPPGEYGGGHVEALFTNQLDSNAHPYFAAVASMRVSAHLLIDRHGALVQFVAFDRRAWHAGVSQFRGRSHCNDFSIGIELEGTDTRPYSDAQYESLITVIRTLMARWPRLDLDHIVGHCDVAPGRKSDPGTEFDWGRLRAALTPEPA